MIEFGCYQLDIDEMTLTKDQCSVVLEPKVLAVLLYLYQHTDNYVSLLELHENVWQGRIVTDAAVRRTIRKLRILFNDDHKQPEYIKSLPKRGYKLICQASEQTINKQPIDQSTLDNGQQRSPETTIYQPFFYQHKKLSILVILIVLFIFSLIGFYTTNKSSNTLSIKTEIIKSIPGKKIAIAQSPDKRYLAYSGLLNEQVGYQVYLQENKQSIIAVSKKTNLPSSIAFSSDSNTLFYVDFKLGDSSLNKVVLDDAHPIGQKLPVGEFNFISDVFTSNQPNQVYFVGQKHVNSPTSIYHYDLNVKKLEQITFSSQINKWDIKGEFSSDGKLLAVLRTYRPEENHEIRIIDISTGQVVSRLSLQHLVYDIQWLNNDSLLINTDQKLIKFNYLTNKQQFFKNNNLKFSAIAAIDGNHLIALSRLTNANNPLFLEQTLPIDKWQTNRVIQPGKHTLQVFHQQPNSKLTLSINNNVTTLSLLNTTTNASTPYIETEYQLSYIDSNLDGTSLLIKLNNRFSLFNTLNQNITHFTSSQQLLGDASYSADHASIIYTVKNFDSWEVYRYKIKEQTISLLTKGFKYVRPFGTKYIVADDKGQLYIFSNNNQEAISLNEKISIEPNTRWAVQGRSIFWSNHDMVHTTFHQLNIKNIKNPVKKSISFNYSKVSPIFSISTDGSSFIYSSKNSKTNINLITIE